MAAPVSRPAFSDYISETSGTISFRFGRGLGRTSYLYSFEQASAFTSGLLSTMKKTELVFDDVVASRSITKKCLSTGAIEHSLASIRATDCSYEQFVKIITYPNGVPNEEWQLDLRLSGIANLNSQHKAESRYLISRL